MTETSSRLLQLLALLQARRDWPGRELAQRLEVSERTVRRDVERLRRIQEMTAELGMNLAGVERVFELEEQLEAMAAKVRRLEKRAARLAAEAVDSSRIRLLDSGTVTMQLGWAAIAAARAAQAGLGADEVVAAAQSNLQRSRLFAVLETLEYVYRGGRIGRAAQLVGSMLSIKPILTVENGEVVPLERVRTWRRAIERLVDLTRQEAPLESLAVMHAGNLSDAQAIADRLRDLVPPEQLIFTQAGPVLATYAGPGALGVMPVKAAQ